MKELTQLRKSVVRKVEMTCLQVAIGAAETPSSGSNYPRAAAAACLAVSGPKVKAESRERRAGVEGRVCGNLSGWCREPSPEAGAGEGETQE